MEYCDINVINIASVGDVVLTERVDKMIRKDGSLVLDFRLMGALEVRDGKIVRCTAYLDTMGHGEGTRVVGCRDGAPGLKPSGRRVKCLSA